MDGKVSAPADTIPVWTGEGARRSTFSDYILLPLRAALARGILGSWSGAITGLDGAGRKLFAGRGIDLANFLIDLCWGRPG